MGHRHSQYQHRNPNDPNNGMKYKFPCSPKYAEEIRVKRWTNVGTVCPDCNTKDPVRYVGNNECSHCIWKSFEDQHKSLNLDPARYTLHRKLCSNGPHLRLTFAGGKKCINCETNSLSPRQQAIQADETWYMPTISCSKCGKQALKRVDNGKCQGCQPPKVVDLRRVDYDTLIPPGTIIDRATARTMGLSHYRTGKPCKRGHLTVRHVSSGICVKCR